MKALVTAALLAVLVLSACSTKEKAISKSYLSIKNYLIEANILETDIIYFYAEKPRTPLPNVHCFDSNGIQLNAPPQCFQYINDYIKFLNDSVIPPKKDNIPLKEFITSVPIIDVHDQPLTSNSVSGYDYYLFIDFIAIPDNSFKETLYTAKQGVANSRKKIKLFLIHAVSEKNAHTLGKAKSLPDSVNNKQIQPGIVKACLL